MGDNISTVEGIQYFGGISSVLWGDNSSTCVGIASVLWGIPSVLWRLFSTVGDNISTVGDSFSTVEGIQYIGGITLVHAGDNISTVGVLWGITSVLWRVFSTLEGYLQYCGGITAVHVRG